MRRSITIYIPTIEFSTGAWAVQPPATSFDVAARTCIGYEQLEWIEDPRGVNGCRLWTARHGGYHYGIWERELVDWEGKLADVE